MLQRPKWRILRVWTCLRLQLPKTPPQLEFVDMNPLVLLPPFVTMDDVRDFINTLQDCTTVAVAPHPFRASTYVIPQIENENLISFLEILDIDLFILPVLHP